jgi:hypothetical protein
VKTGNLLEVQFMLRFLPVFSFALLAACVAPETPPSASAPVNSYAGYSSSTLWALQETTTSAAELRFIEAELGTRNEFASGYSFVGKRTAQDVGTKRYSRGSAGDGDRDCGSFASSAAAQRFFLLNGGPASDRHNLDGDGDGYACEWGAAVRAYAAKYRPAAKVYAPARSYRSSSKCYVGPRGGTYTITAGGSKNYDGC